MAIMSDSLVSGIIESSPSVAVEPLLWPACLRASALDCYFNHLRCTPRLFFSDLHVSRNSKLNYSNEKLDIHSCGHLSQSNVLSASPLEFGGVCCCNVGAPGCCESTSPLPPHVFLEPAGTATANRTKQSDFPATEASAHVCKDPRITP